MAIQGQRCVGSYRLFSLIRSGHASEIWAVRPMNTEEPYAMKLIPPGEMHTRANLGSLKHEFAVGSQMDHPNIVRIMDYASTRAGSFLIMELFRFPNLKQRIQYGVDRLASLTEKVIRQAAAGLGHLHEKGWIHCDVKPDNFLVDREGNVKLIDFNLARKRAGGLGKLFGVRAKVQGTISYMSPEQIRGQSIDEQSDIYSFGCVIHEMFSGKPPLTGTSARELLSKHLKTIPAPLTALNHNVDQEFAELVLRMMAKRPKKRPESIDDFLQELAAVKIFRRRPEPIGSGKAKQDKN